MKIKQCFKHGLLSLGSILASLSLHVKAEDKIVILSKLEINESILAQVKNISTQIANLETKFNEIKNMFTDDPKTYNLVSEVLSLYQDLEEQIKIVNLFIDNVSVLDGFKITEKITDRMSVVTNRVKELISQKEKGHHYIGSEMNEDVYLVFTKEIGDVLRALLEL